MENQRVYGTSNMRVLLENEAISTEAFESLLAPGFHGSRSAMDFEGGHENRAGRPLYGSLGLEETRDFDEGLHQPEKKRRLSADQVHFLERSFELENKLEPERKAQLARDLGLEPRQVAIWFQNRRARWKTKQMEKDYETLKSSYDVLKADYDNLLMEKEKLHAEVLSLTNKLLLKEKNNGDSGSLESSKIPQVSQKIDSSCAADRKKSDAPAIVCKQEDLSSANSAVLDSESPYHTDEGGHSMLMEPDHSDLSHVGDVDDVKVCDFLRLEDNNSSNYEFPMEDPALWFWP